MSLDTLTWASWYVGKGWSVIPLVPGEKIPALKEGEVFEYRKRLPSKNELTEWFEGTNNNLGILTGTDHGPIVVDVDSSEGLKAFNILTNFQRYQTPLVKTGKGYHLYFQKSNDEIRNRARFITDCDIRGTGGYVVAPPSLNGTGKPYSWMRRPDEYDLLPMPQEITMKISSTVADIHARDSPLEFTAGTRDEDIYSAAVASYKGGLSRQKAEALVLGLAKSCDPPFPPQEALAKVRSAYENLPSERNLSAEVREWVDDSNGVFHIGELFRTLRSDKRGERNIRSYVKKLCDQGVLERITGKNANYRRVLNDLVPIDFKGAKDTGVFDLGWPSNFHFDRMFNLYPGNIAVIAGSPNAGKTALCLNLIALNCNKYPTNYFTCELTPSELKQRLELFEDRDLDSFNFNAYELSANFADQVSPNALNIIDYWQPGENMAFYQIAEDLDKIYKKLDGTGLAVVCIQKRKDQDLGRGAEFSMERPRLYISMDYRKLKLVKVKSPVPGMDPNNRSYQFKLIRGCEFTNVIETTDEKEE